MHPPPQFIRSARQLTTLGFQFITSALMYAQQPPSNLRSLGTAEALQLPSAKGRLFLYIRAGGTLCLRVKMLFPIHSSNDGEARSFGKLPGRHDCRSEDQRVPDAMIDVVLSPHSRSNTRMSSGSVAEHASHLDADHIRCF